MIRFLQPPHQSFRSLQGYHEELGLTGPDHEHVTLPYRHCPTAAADISCQSSVLSGLSDGNLTYV